MEVGGGFLQLVLDVHVHIVPRGVGIGGHQPPGRHLAPFEVAPQVARKRQQRARRARQRQPHRAQKHARRALELRHAGFQPPPDHPCRHNEGQDHEAHHMRAHHRKAHGKAQYQLAQIGLARAPRLKSREKQHRPQKRQNAPDVPGRAFHGEEQIRHQVKQHHAQQHPAPAPPARHDQQRQIGRRHVERVQPQPGKDSLVVGIAHLTAGMEQAVAHVQFQRGKVAVAAKMAGGVVLFQEVSQVAVLTVALGEGQVFARVAPAHALHAGHVAHAHRRKQNDHASRKARRGHRGPIHAQKGPQPLCGGMRGRASVQKGPQPSKAAEPHPCKTCRRQHRRHTDIDPPWGLGPHQRQQQHPQILAQGRGGHTREKAGHPMPGAEPAPQAEPKAQRRRLKPAGEQKQVAPAIADVKPRHQPFLPALASLSISAM